MAQRKRWYLVPAAPGSILGEGRKFSGIIFGKKLMFQGKSTAVDCLWCEECKKLNSGRLNASSTDMGQASTTKN